MFAVSVLRFDSDKAKINACTAIIILTLVALMPLFLARFLHKRRENLAKPELKERYGTLYDGIRTGRPLQYNYSVVFVIRRLFFATITVFLLDFPHLAAQLFCLSNIVYISYFGFARPHDTTLSRRLEYFNEVFLQLASYHLILFPLSVSLEDEQVMGWTMIGFIVSVFIVNLTVILVINILTLKRKLYLRRLKKKQEL